MIEAQPPAMNEGDEFLTTPPWKRVRDGREDLHTTITGILLGFKYLLDEREGHMDIITYGQAEDEIKALIDHQVGEAIGHAQNAKPQQDELGS